MKDQKCHLANSSRVPRFLASSFQYLINSFLILSTTGTYHLSIVMLIFTHYYNRTSSGALTCPANTENWLVLSISSSSIVSKVCSSWAATNLNICLEILCFPLQMEIPKLWITTFEPPRDSSDYQSCPSSQDLSSGRPTTTWSSWQSSTSQPTWSGSSRASSPDWCSSSLVWPAAVPGLGRCVLPPPCRERSIYRSCSPCSPQYLAAPTATSPSYCAWTQWQAWVLSCPYKTPHRLPR